MFNPERREILKVFGVPLQVTWTYDPDDDYLQIDEVIAATPTTNLLGVLECRDCMMELTNEVRQFEARANLPQLSQFSDLYHGHHAR